MSEGDRSVDECEEGAEEPLELEEKREMMRKRGSASFGERRRARIKKNLTLPSSACQGRKKGR